MSIEMIICVVSCLLHLFWSFIESVVTHKKLSFICDKCGFENKVESNKLLTECQLAALTVFLSALRGEENGHD